MSAALDVAAIAAAAAGGGGVMGVIVTRVFDWGTGTTKRQNAKIDADAAEVIAKTAVSLVAPLNSQVEDLAKRVGVLEQENEKARTKLQIAVVHIRTLYNWIYTHIHDKQPPEVPEELELDIAQS